jgi:hypothetical protein
MDEGKTMRRGLRIALGLLLVFGAATSPTSAGHTIVVDDDGEQCPGAHFGPRL